jgi:hypothetical protein
LRRKAIALPAFEEFESRRSPALKRLLGHEDAACAAEIASGTHFLSFDAAAKPSRAPITNPDICRPRISASLFGYAPQAHERSGGI